jgi:hypothetical protein
MLLSGSPPLARTEAGTAIPLAQHPQQQHMQQQWKKEKRQE